MNIKPGMYWIDYPEPGEKFTQKVIKIDHELAWVETVPECEGYWHREWVTFHDIKTFITHSNITPRYKHYKSKLGKVLYK